MKKIIYSAAVILSIAASQADPLHMTCRKEQAHFHVVYDTIKDTLVFAGSSRTGILYHGMMKRSPEEADKFIGFGFEYAVKGRRTPGEVRVKKAFFERIKRGESVPLAVTALREEGKPHEVTFECHQHESNE